MSRSDYPPANIPVVPPPSRPPRGPGRWLVVGVFVIIIGLSSALVIQNKVRQGALADARATIRVSSDGFAPDVVTIKTGQTVRWTNDDTVEHRIISSTMQSSPFDERLLRQQDSFTATFDSKGTYSYYDDSRHEATATVIVE
jgi:plastocyanin